jgi:hypothetical protein
MCVYNFAHWDKLSRCLPLKGVVVRTEVPQAMGSVHLKVSKRWISVRLCGHFTKNSRWPRFPGQVMEENSEDRPRPGKRIRLYET